MVKVFPKSGNQSNEMVLTICNFFRQMRDWKVENLANVKELSIRTEKEDYLCSQYTIFDKFSGRLGCLLLVRINRLGRAMNNGKSFPKIANQPKEITLSISNSIFHNCCRLMRDCKLESLINGQEISAVPFRTEKEVYLWRQSTISDRNFHKNFRSTSL